MTRITTMFPKVRQHRLIEVSFSYDNGFGLEWHVTAQVETDGCDHYEMILASGPGVDDVSEETYRCIKEKAEELAWQRENQPRNAKGCDCLPKVNPLDQAIHDDTCPLRLRGEEREAYLEQEHRDARS